MFITSIVSLIVSVGLIAGGFILFKKQVVGSAGAEREELIAEIDEISVEANKTIARKDRFVAKAQIDYLEDQINKLKEDLENEKKSLKETEARLTEAQSAVEGKEAAQQEIRSAKEEDETKLEELLTTFEELSTDSISLEQKLAECLKNLDRIVNEIEIPDNLKVTLQSLLSSLENAGSRLRELILEYQTVDERLKVLKEQHADLEEEYTRLVEKQLGE